MVSDRNRKIPGTYWTPFWTLPCKPGVPRRR